jgi:hypothetical protein
MSGGGLLPKDTLDFYDARVRNRKSNTLDEVLHVALNRVNSAGFARSTLNCMDAE